MKNKGAALAVCLVILIASVGFYFYSQGSKNNSDVVGIEKNWWDDPGSDEQKWLEQNNYELRAQATGNKTVEVEEDSDHYTEMVQLKSKHSQQIQTIRRNIQELQAQLQNASSALAAQNIKREIAKRQEELRHIKEDDQFIQLLTGQ